MSSLSLFYLRQDHPGKSDEEIARMLAEKYRCVAVVRYKSSADGDYTNIGCCDTRESMDNYFNSPFCHDTQILYDARQKSLLITKELILGAACDLCGKSAGAAALQLHAGDDYYVCSCGRFFCDQCYLSRLPLTNPAGGYGMCPVCKREVKRAIVGTYVS